MLSETDGMLLDNELDLPTVASCARLHSNCGRRAACCTQSLPLLRVSQREYTSFYRKDVISSFLLCCSRRDVGQFKAEH